MEQITEMTKTLPKKSRAGKIRTDLTVNRLVA